MEVDGEPVKALAQASKNGWLYILNRETGELVHPIIETPVSTQTDIEGENHGQPNPFPIRKWGARAGSPVFPTDIPAQHMEQNELVEQFT